MTGPRRREKSECSFKRNYALRAVRFCINPPFFLRDFRISPNLEAMAALARHKASNSSFNMVPVTSKQCHLGKNASP
jgi:hypothetical protein